jgi:hypothetical protein
MSIWEWGLSSRRGVATSLLYLIKMIAYGVLLLVNSFPSFTFSIVCSDTSEPVYGLASFQAVSGFILFFTFVRNKKQSEREDNYNL